MEKRETCNQITDREAVGPCFKEEKNRKKNKNKKRRSDERLKKALCSFCLYFVALTQWRDDDDVEHFVKNN